MLQYVAVTQPINALSFILDGLNYGASDFKYSAISTVSAVSLLHPKIELLTKVPWTFLNCQDCTEFVWLCSLCFRDYCVVRHFDSGKCSCRCPWLYRLQLFCWFYPST